MKLKKTAMMAVVIILIALFCIPQAALASPSADQIVIEDKEVTWYTSNVNGTQIRSRIVYEVTLTAKSAVSVSAVHFVFNSDGEGGLHIVGRSADLKANTRYKIKLDTTYSLSVETYFNAYGKATGTSAVNQHYSLSMQLGDTKFYLEDLDIPTYFYNSGAHTPVIEVTEIGPASASGTPSSSVKAIPTTQLLSVNGKMADFAAAFNINDENYFKLRDIAVLVNTFDITYNSSTNTIEIIPNKTYTPNGTESKSKPKGFDSIAATNDKVKMNGKELPLTAYKIDGSNYYRLRDLGTYLGFNVDYNESTKTILVTT